MSSSHFASRHRKDLSTDMIRTKIAHRKSLSQKENRHKEYERNRHFGLKDVNIPTLEGRLLLELDETSQELVPEKANVKPRSAKTLLGDQRKQMLQKYKEEKQLQKLKEQREKAKRGVFKVGLYRPDMPCFLLSNQNTMKAEPKKAVPSFVRMTRSRTKDQMELVKIDNGSDVRATRPNQRQTSEKKVLDKEKKAVQPVMPTSVRMTRSATQAAKQIARTVSSTTTRKPVTRATNDNEAERKATNQGRPAKNIETKRDKGISFQVDSEENNLDSQTSATKNGVDPDGVLSKMEDLPKTNTSKMKGKNSFAPKDFMFQPLDGLKTYQVTPMTPRSASAFLTPNYAWTPLKTEVDKTQEATKEISAQKFKTYSAKTVHQDSNKLQCPLDSLTVWNKENVLNKNETTKNSNGLPINEVPSLETHEDQVPQPQHDVPYFRNILQSETEKLSSYCLEWDRKLELDIPDDVKDLIRTAVGQTRLLMKERFKQFEGLVDDCEYKRGKKETTCTDLDGFWDMISFQIEDVNKKFNNLTKLEESGWQNNTINKKVVRKKVVSCVASKPKQDDSGRIAARNRLAAIKNAMRERIKQEEHAEAAASVMPKEVDKIVFDAGFFRVESPVKSFSGLSVSSEHLSQRLRTPKSVSKAVSEIKAEVGPLRKTTSPETPQSTGSEHGDKKTSLSNIPENRNCLIEDVHCPRLQDLIEVNPDINKINFEMYYLPSEGTSLPLHAGEVAYDINTNKKEEISDVVEGMELNSSITAQDVLMGSPEKSMSSHNISQEEETKTSQSVLFDKSLTTECHLLDSPGLTCSNPFTHVERRLGEHARHISFGGNLITFSPLRPLSGEQPEEFLI
ncbi:disks large-associated protein 5 isoform X1 [Rousettus aegyptiacus]|uniref:DLG associated protein 5 n=1 Tax=Rousettus aegyptiacus TaxID=9407 RepID=A0A7J8IHC3_ROUAE|nr:disks large-associated protein 5 isoform X1 [Rousettus aegyptiacus]KAF6484007.1 DLG associated protein 5 [Rousettus aegyptiacus]